jgi:HAD-superfamily subfamily IB hydrolase
MFSLENYTLEEVREIGRRVAVEYRDHQDYVFSKELIKFLRQEGFELVAISGSPKFLVDAFVKEYCFSKGIGQDYVKDEKTSIFKESSIKTYQDKHIFIEELLQDRSSGDFNRDDFYIVAVGDTECDFSMMNYVDKAFIINPSIRFFSKIVEFFKIGKIKQYSDFGKYTIVTERKRRTIIQYIRTFPINSGEFHVDTWSPLILKDSDIAETLKNSV